MTIDDIPMHLKDAHYQGAKNLEHGLNYQYPHNFKNHYIKQDYLPKEIENKIYYEPCDNKTEQLYKDYWDSIKNNS